MYNVSRREMEIQAWREIVPKMFERLNEHVGESVQYVCWLYEKKQKLVTVLRSVDNFNSAEFFYHRVPFIGNKCAIISVNLARTGELLYYNPFVENDDYVKKTSDEVIRLREELFGYENDTLEDEEKSARLKEYLLIQGGMMVVRPELELDWYEYVMGNEKLGYKQATEIVLSSLQRLARGAFCSEVFKLYSDLLDLEDDFFDVINDGIVYFSLNGRQYENYLFNRGIIIGDKRKGGSFIKKVLEPRENK